MFRQSPVRPASAHAEGEWCVRMGVSRSWVQPSIVRVNRSHDRTVSIRIFVAVLAISGECAGQWDLNVERPLVSAITPRMTTLAREQLELSDSQLQTLNELVASHAANFAEFASAWRGKLRDLDKATVDPSLRAVDRWELEGRAFQTGKEVADRQAAMDEAVLSQLRAMLTPEQSARWNDFYMRWLDARGAGSSSAITCEGRIQLLEILDRFAAKSKESDPASSKILLDAAHAYANEACPIRIALLSASVRVARESRDELEARAEVHDDGTVRIGDFRHSSDQVKYSKWSKQVEKYAIALGKLNLAFYDRLERELPPSVFHELAWSFWDTVSPSDVAVREAREWVRFYSLAMGRAPEAGSNRDAIQEVLAKGDRMLQKHLRIIATIANSHPGPGDSPGLQPSNLQRAVDDLAAERQSLQRSAIALFPESAQGKLSDAKAAPGASTAPPK